MIGIVLVFNQPRRCIQLSILGIAGPVFAERIGYSKSDLSRWESDRRTPTRIDQCYALACGLANGDSKRTAAILLDLAQLVTQTKRDGPRIELLADQPAQSAVSL